jgi:Asp-tRNA(Asn)/Glu-tRNA(Gln) amidotransferase A subunit family amidase
MAGLAGVPVVVAPLATMFGFPLGIAFVGAPGTDLALLDLVRRLMTDLAAQTPLFTIAPDDE